MLEEPQLIKSMIKLLIIKLFLSFAIICNSADVCLVWDFNPPYELVNYYSIYGSKSFNNQKLLGMVSSTTNRFCVKNLTPGTHYFSVTAHNYVGSSKPSSRKINIKK